jgi:hypothetical protein
VQPLPSNGGALFSPEAMVEASPREAAEALFERPAILVKGTVSARKRTSCKARGINVGMIKALYHLKFNPVGTTRTRAKPTSCVT